jgi:hypothetical protein
MTHNFSVITTVALCDSFISANQVEKSDINFRVTTLNNRISSGASKAEEVANDLSAAQSELTFYKITFDPSVSFDHCKLTVCYKDAIR